MIKLRPNDQRARNAVFMIWIVFAVEVFSFISAYFQYDLLQTVANGGDISEETANANDLREQLIAIVYLICYLISVVVFIQWFRRAYYNLHLRINYLSHSEGWAAGSWFVPFVNLYRPYQIMKELYVETRDLLTKKGIDFDRAFSTRALGVWWALWLVNNFIGQVLFRYSMKAQAIDELIISTVGSMINNAAGIPLALVAIKVIKDYANIELLLNQIPDESAGPQGSVS